MNGKKVFVVGGAGFIGSHVVDRLIEMGAHVSVIDKLCIPATAQFINPRASHYRLDIADPSVDLVELFKDADYVFNYAAEPYIPDCISSPVKAIQSNILGPLRVLEAVTKAKVKALLQVTSAEVYGNSNNYTEDTAKLEGVSTYAVTKVATDMLAQCRFLEKAAPVIVLRQFNCVGARETHPYVIPEIITQATQQAFEEQPEIHLGNNSSRDFLHVKDAAEMAIDLIQHGQWGEVYNMGSEYSIKIYDLAVKICRDITEKEPVIVTDPKRLRPKEIWQLKANNDKLYNTIKTRPTRDLEEGVKDAIDHYNQLGSWVWEFKNASV